MAVSLRIPDLPARLEAFQAAAGQVFFGQAQSVAVLLYCLSAGLHALIEDLPGTGKTTLARTLARLCGLSFRRIQFTPDLLPGDILGSFIWHAGRGDFVFRAGQLDASFLLADEINRASPRTQSAFLEALQEGQYTVEGVTQPLSRPFFLLATQNPPTMGGTFPLPEAQLDRLAVCLSLGYPDHEQALALLKSRVAGDPWEGLAPLADTEQWLAIQHLVKSVTVPAPVQSYLLQLAEATRRCPELRQGLSPRWTVHLQTLLQAKAAWSGRDLVLPEDGHDLAVLSAAHRVILAPEARLKQRTAKAVLTELWDRIPLPTGLK